MSIPSGISLCHPQNRAYCTDGSKKFLADNLKIVSMPSRRTSALSNCKIPTHTVKGCTQDWEREGVFSQFYLFQQALPHFLYIYRFFFQGKFSNCTEERRLRIQTLNILLQPLVSVNTCDGAQQRLPLILANESNVHHQFTEFIQM